MHKWSELKAATLTPRSARKYEAIVRQTLKEIYAQGHRVNPKLLFIKSMKGDDLELDLEAYKDIRAACRNSEYNYDRLESFLDWVGNPVLKRYPVKWAKREPRRYWLTTEQTLYLWNVLRAQGQVDRIWIFALGTFAGLRKGEITELRHEDVNVTQGNMRTLRVYGKSRGGKKIRYVPIDPRVWQAYQDLGPKPDGKILAVGKTSVENRFLEFEAILEERWPGTRFPPHAARRTFADQCFQAGLELRRIQFLLGHESVTTTEDYLRPMQLTRDNPLLQVMEYHEKSSSM